jgi:ATP-binding cassette, subfamily B, bacterial
MKIVHYKQIDLMDCGPTCLKMVAASYGKDFPIERLRQIAGINKDGVNILGIAEGAKSLGFDTDVVEATLEELKGNVPMPFIAYWNTRHFVVVYKIEKDKVTFADPAVGLSTCNIADFEKRWAKQNAKSGIVLLLEPTTSFFELETSTKSKIKFIHFLKYFLENKRLIFQLVLVMLVGNVIQLSIPYLTKSVVDIGIKTKDIHFLYLILLSQLMVTVGRTVIEFVKSWITLGIQASINLKMLSDFIFKLLRLPISFYEKKMVGDIMQRLTDFNRIESFITQQSLGIIFSVFNLIVLSTIIIQYDVWVYAVYIIGSLLYAVWVWMFLKIRRELDFKSFDISATGSTNFIQLLQGIYDVKLANAERKMQWDWEKIQVKSVLINMKSMSVNQIQELGGTFINETKNILAIFLTAKSVIDGNMTLGSMLAIQQIIGQLNAPIQQLIGLSQSLQDAKISLERLNEVYELEPENHNSSTLDYVPEGDIIFKNVAFTYPGAGNLAVFNNLNLTIKRNKTTAIVGMSGSGKTTLIKLLLGFYEADSGEISLGKEPLLSISKATWRQTCGSVLQDGYIFSDTVLQNISLGHENPTIEKVKEAAQLANIDNFIETLPQKYFSIIGSEGNSLSQGQRQRILIARAIYKNPKILLFDEATSALDSENEAIITQNLDKFLAGRTSVIVAHRMSTIQNADNIIVLDKGEIVEMGNHQDLKSLKGKYYELIKNQLEIDK